MIIGQALNGAIRSTYLRVTLPFRAAFRMLFQGARRFIWAVGRLGAEISAYVLFVILATGRGVRRAVQFVGSAIASAFRFAINLPIKVLQGILALGRRAFLMAVSAITSVYRSVVFVLAKVGRWIKNGTLSIMRTFRRSMVWIGHVIATVATMPFRLAAMAYVAVRRSTGWVSRRLTDSIAAGYRALVFSAAATSMTLSMEDGHARLLVLKGDRIIAWRSGQIGKPPEVSAPVSEDGAEPEESAAAPVYDPLGSLLEGLPARSKRVVADLPLHVPLLRHIPLPDVKGRFLREIVNTEVLNSVPFSQDEVDIQWRIEQGEDIREASVIAIPRERMDGQIKILRGSRLAPSAVYSKAASLAVAVARANVFILHMTQAQTAVILVREGVTRIVHRLELPRDLNGQVEAIAMGVGQVAGYHRSQRPDDDVGSLPIVVTGELDQVEELVGLLGTALDRPVLPFEPDLDCPQGFDSAEFASNIGLHLVSHSKKATKVISAQNVLPERHRPRPLPVVPTAVFAGLLLLAFLAFNVGGWVSDIAGESGPLNARLDIREEQARDYRLAIARQNVITQRIADADVEALGLVNNLESFEKEMGTLLSRLSDITTNAGLSNVDLTRLVPLPEGFSVSGSADRYSDVLEYAALMRDSPNFQDATVLQVAEATGSRLGFTVVITIAAFDDEVGEGVETQGRSP
ncbi:MAG: hypothetical protein IH872_13555 [Chloroflexi bacterium]|nr:hypothetical protein [Chloroflexota bacterium]